MSGQISPLYLIDGFNLLHAAILSGKARRNWWSVDNQRRVVKLAEGFDGAQPGSLWVVFDRREGVEPGAQGPDGECQSTSRVTVHFAPSADDWIVQTVQEREQQSHGMAKTHVVSADRALQDRACHRGSVRLSPWVFARMCGAEPGNRATDRADVE